MTNKKVPVPFFIFTFFIFYSLLFLWDSMREVRKKPLKGAFSSSILLSPHKERDAGPFQKLLAYT